MRPITIEPGKGIIYEMEKACKKVTYRDLTPKFLQEILDGIDMEAHIKEIRDKGEHQEKEFQSFLSMWGKIN